MGVRGLVKIGCRHVDFFVVQLCDVLFMSIRTNEEMDHLMVGNHRLLDTRMMR